MSEYPEVEKIARLMELAAKYGLEDLKVEEGGLKVRLTADTELLEEVEGSVGTRAYLWAPPMMHEPQQPQRSETARPVLAPLTGTFYRSGSPDAPPFVEVGTEVEEGQTIGLIEAMKVFSEVKADCSGVVTEIVVQNGKLIQRDEVVLYLEPQP